MMQTTRLPETVVQTWGTEVAEDFMVWLEERVSNLLLADEPRLVQTPGGGWTWRVPVDLTFPSRGRVGCVGEVDVDARYGKVHYDDGLLARITREAQRLAQQTQLVGVFAGQECTFARPKQVSASVFPNLRYSLSARGE
jgi:hypothetical protein